MHWFSRLRKMAGRKLHRQLIFKTPTIKLWQLLWIIIFIFFRIIMTCGLQLRSLWFSGPSRLCRSAIQRLEDKVTQFCKRNEPLNFLVFGRNRKKEAQKKKQDERSGRFSPLSHQIQVSESLFYKFSNCAVPQVHLTTILFLFLLLSAPFLSGSGEAESRDILSPSSPLHNPGNILSFCSQPSGDLTIPASGSAAAIARWSKPALTHLSCKNYKHVEGPILKNTALYTKTAFFWNPAPI